MNILTEENRNYSEKIFEQIRKAIYIFSPENFKKHDVSMTIGVVYFDLAYRKL